MYVSDNDATNGTYADYHLKIPIRKKLSLLMADSHKILCWVFMC